MKKDRVFRCIRCGNVITLSRDWTDKRIANLEDRCPDPKAPGGYWYCSYEELVPKRKRLSKRVNAGN